MENFIDVEFFKTECSVLVRHFYVLYSISGAMYYENYVRPKFRCFLIVCVFVAYFCCTIFPLKGLMQDPTLENKFFISGYSSLVQTSALLIFTLYKKRREFHNLFDAIQKHADRLTVIELDPENAADYLVENKILKIHYRIYLGLILLYFFLISEKLLVASLLHIDEMPFEINTLVEFFIPFLCDKCDRLISYVLALSSSYLLTMTLTITVVGSLCLIFTLSMYLKNQAIILRNTIKYHSDLTFEKFEKCDADEEQELKKDGPNDFKLRSIPKQRQKYVEEYMSKVHQWIKIHQSFMESADQYRACAKCILEVHLSYCSFGIITLGYFGATFILDEENAGINYAFYGIIHSIFLLVKCYLGGMLNDLSEIISEAIYATPWYYLPAKEQKVILNFLTLSQRDQEIRLFGIFKLNLELFPTILNEAYGYIQIMRLLTMRHGK